MKLRYNFRLFFLYYSITEISTSWQQILCVPFQPYVENSQPLNELDLLIKSPYFDPEICMVSIFILTSNSTLCVTFHVVPYCFCLFILFTDQAQTNFFICSNLYIMIKIVYFTCSYFPIRNYPPLGLFFAL